MTLRKPDEILRQSMHRLIDKFDYLNEDSADYNVNLEEDTGFVRIHDIKKQDLDKCQTLMSDGFDTITLMTEEKNNGKYVVTANYKELP